MWLLRLNNQDLKNNPQNRAAAAACQFSSLQKQLNTDYSPRFGNTGIYFIKKVTNRWTVGLSYKMTRMNSTGKNFLQSIIGNCSIFALVIPDFTYH